MKEDDDILNLTPSQAIPGVLFAAMLKQTLEDYKPGTIITTAAGAGHRAEKHCLAMLEIMISHYEAAAEAEQE